nr:uncharacterized protein LOC107438347 [Parasteatoda tepidariorum]XP_042911121.1 uncharacterized protein LOC107438347 [Parasteatoda tepidariorum]
MKGFVFMLVLGLAAASIEDSDKITQINIRKFLEVLRKVQVPEEENEQFFTDLMIKVAQTENGKKMKNTINDILDQLTSGESERKVKQREFLDKVKLFQILYCYRYSIFY